MPRQGRVVLPNYPLHVVQRGHNRQVVFAEDEDYQVAQVVVTAVQCQVALVDAVHADILASHAAQAATVEHRASGITVLQAADLVGQARIGIAVERLSAAGLRCIGG